MDQGDLAGVRRLQRALGAADEFLSRCSRVGAANQSALARSPHPTQGCPVDGGSVGSAFAATDSRRVSRGRLLGRRGRATRQSGGTADRRVGKTLNRRVEFVLPPRCAPRSARRSLTLLRTASSAKAGGRIL